MGFFSFWVQDKKKRCNIAVIGLDGAGKTTMVNALTGRSGKKVLPTVGVNKPRIIERGGFVLKLFDMGGIASFRRSWRERLLRSHAAIYVVDVSNRKRLLESRDEFLEYLSNADFDGKPILLFANKEDDQKVHVKELTEVFRLKDPSVIQSSSVRIMTSIGEIGQNDGELDLRLWDGLRWLVDELEEPYKGIHQRVTQASKVLDKAQALKNKENKKKVAEKRKLKKQGSTSSATVAPNPQPAPVVVQCKNKYYVGDQRVDCSKEAVQRNAITAWRPFCADCFATAKAEADEKKAEEEGGDTGDAGDAAAPCQSPNSPTSPKSPANETDAEKAERRRRRKEKKERRRKKKLQKKLQEEAAVAAELPFQISTFTVGERVEVNYHGKNKWFAGAVATINPDKTIKVVYDDGDEEDNIACENVIPCSGPQIPSGAKVTVRYRGKSNFFTGKIEKQNPDGESYTVNFDDGDRDEHVKRSWIRILL